MGGVYPGRTGRTSAATRLDGTPSIDRCGRSAHRSVSGGTLFVRPLRFRHVPALTCRKHEELYALQKQPHARYCGKFIRDSECQILSFSVEFFRRYERFWLPFHSDTALAFSKNKVLNSFTRKRLRSSSSTLSYLRCCHGRWTKPRLGDRTVVVVVVVVGFNVPLGTY